MDAQPVRQPALTRVGCAVAIAIACVACGSGGASSPVAPVSRPATTTTTASAAKESLPFLHDDWQRALAEAKRKNKPIFVDAWAPWCHSCQSMRAYVLTDPSLAPLAADFVWLTIDTEKDENAAFVARYTNKVWPTLWVIDGAREDVVMKWEGTATADELRTLLDAARSGGDSTTVAFVRASHDAARGDMEDAEKGYREVLRAASHPQRARAVEALVGILQNKKDWDACTTLAVGEAPKLEPGTSRATALAIGLECAREAKRKDDVARLFDAALKAANDPDPRTAADDRSALFEELVETRKDAGDERGAKELAETWARYLEGEAKRAPTKQARAVFDAHRLSAYIAAGDPSRAIPMLEESQRDFPDDYNPPARLARVYLELHRLDDAKAAIDRASAKVYGPRSLRVFALAADIAKARGDRASERAALEQALARTARAPLNESQRKLRDGLEKRLRALP